jgi:hypothetical protein
MPASSRHTTSPASEGRSPARRRGPYRTVRFRGRRSDEASRDSDPDPRRRNRRRSGYSARYKDPPQDRSPAGSRSSPGASIRLPRNRASSDGTRAKRGVRTAWICGVPVLYGSAGKRAPLRFFGLAPNARKALRHASRWSAIRTGNCGGGSAMENSGRKSRPTTLSARYAGYRCQTAGSTVERNAFVIAYLSSTR